MMASETSTSSSSLPSDWRRESLGEGAKLKYIMDNNLFVDVTFRVGSDTGSPVELIQAHSLILKMYSSVFETMFSGNFKESTAVPSEPIDVPDVEPSAFKNMLKFLIESHLDDSLDAEDLLFVLYAAKKYAIFELEQECRRLIKEKISEESAVSVLQAAQQLDEEDLEAHARKFIRWNFEAIMESDDFLEMSVENLCEFLKDDNTIAFERNIFNGMLRWASSQCVEADIAVTPENQRQVMKEAFHLIRFPIIRPTELALSVIPAAVLTKDEVVIMFQHELTSAVLRLSKSLIPSLPFSNKKRNFYVTYEGTGLDLGEIGGKSVNGVRKWSCKLTSDKPVTIISFGFSSPSQNETTLYDVQFKIYFADDEKQSTCLAEGNHTSKEFTSYKAHHLRLQRPLLLVPSRNYSVFFSVKGPKKTRSYTADTKSDTRTVYSYRYSRNVTFTVTPDAWMPSIRCHF